MQDGPGVDTLLELGPAAPWGCVPVGSTALCLVGLQRSQSLGSALWSCWELVPMTETPAPHRALVSAESIPV